MSNNANNPQLNEMVSFIQHDIPGLEDGKYQLQAAQLVKDADGKVVSDDSITTTYTFAVTGDRFALSKPTDSLYSLFPAANATGEFNAVLPSAVFTKTTFPWSRYPTKTLNEEYGNTPPPPGQDTDVDMSTWLTVLLLDDEDITNYAQAFPSFALPPANVTIGDLFATVANPKSSLQDNYSYFYEVLSATPPLDTYMDPGDQLTDNIQVLDIPLPLFWKMAPTINDLKLTAHVRKVSLINKPTMPGISDVGEPEGSFSIVFGTRLPGPDRKTYAYLVSLEQMEDFLPTDENGGAPVNTDGFNPDPTKMLRLAVLTSWSFYSTGDSAAFVDQLNALNNATLPVNNVVNGNLTLNTNLRLPVPPTAMPVVQDALNMGYVPLNHNLRTGELSGGVVTPDKTVSWYRGPLTPYLISKAAINLPIASPDQATIFDPTTGMLDASYAAAWMLGRQMALKDTAFSTALYNWKKGITQDVINAVEMQLLAETFSQVFAPVTEKAVAVQQARLARNAAAIAPGAVPLAEVRQPVPKAVKGSFMLKAILSLNEKK